MRVLLTSFEALSRRMPEDFLLVFSTQLTGHVTKLLPRVVRGMTLVSRVACGGRASF